MSRMVVLRTYEFAHLAHLDRAKLADEGIESFVLDENIAALDPVLSQAIGGIRLVVPKQDLERANTLLGLNEYHQLSKAFEGQIQPQSACPICGSLNIYQRRSLLSGLIFLFLFFVPMATRTDKFRCGSCGYEWTGNN